MGKRVEVVEQEDLLEGFFRIRRYRLRHSLFAGGMSAELERLRVEDLGAVSVLLYDPDLDRVVLIEQFRVGAMEAGEGAWLLETIGGYLEPGESLEDVARRETREEAGCDLLDLAPICEFYVSPGISVERISLYCGRVDSTRADGIHGLDEEGEDIRVLVMPAEEAINELYGGRVNSTSVIIAMQWLAMHRDQLRARWTDGD